MSTALPTQLPSSALPIESIWRAPLVPVALVGTLGLVLDRYQSVPLPVSLSLVLAGMTAWLATRNDKRSSVPLVYLALAVVGLSAAYHHVGHDLYPLDDIGQFATLEPRPAHLRGVLDEEPVLILRPPDPLQSFPRPDQTVTVLRATHLRGEHDWLPVSGRVRLTVAGQLEGFHVGDAVAVVGRFATPPAPANPGEFDYAAYLRDQRIRAILSVQKTSDGVTRLAETWSNSLTGWLAVVRGWGQVKLHQALPRAQSGVAAALLLGEGSTMTHADWDKYIRTGVIHVLAISGQHLVVLAAFLWGLLRLLSVRRRRGALFIALFLLGYALLVGGRPPVLRSAVAVCALAGGLLLRRPVLMANSFALAWITVAVLNPTDIFNTGCQLSFLAVAVLYWGTSRWLRFEPDSVAQLIEEARPGWQRLLRAFGRAVGTSYAATAIIWLAVAPLVAARYHLVSPVALFLGPPLTLLTSVALVSGFLLLFSAALCWPLVPLFAGVTHLSLWACELLVDFSDGLSFGHWYVGDIPDWWLWLFYPVLLATMTLQTLQVHWRWPAFGGLAWLCVGLLGGANRPLADELRCTFLAVGHGGCTVIEAPDGRTLLYDAGGLNGPDVTRRQIAPFLWQRGIRRIDEVFLSHADLDHFNGLPALLERFAIGQVTCTPSFGDKTTTGVRVTLDALHQAGVAVRSVRAGDVLTAGGITLEVFHPPAQGPLGNENTRSLVLLIHHAGNSLLLTGDLEGEGLRQVLALPPTPVDVLMAPHHGSRLANKPELAEWARPKVVVSCQGLPRWPAQAPEPYSAGGAYYLGTWPHGAITIHSRESSLSVETFQTGQRLVVK